MCFFRRSGQLLYWSWSETISSINSWYNLPRSKPPPGSRTFARMRRTSWFGKVTLFCWSDVQMRRRYFTPLGVALISGIEHKPTALIAYCATAISFPLMCCLRLGEGKQAAFGYHERKRSFSSLQLTENIPYMRRMWLLIYIRLRSALHLTSSAWKISALVSGNFRWVRPTSKPANVRARRSWRTTSANSWSD